MPFITEELWHEIRERDKEDCVVVASWPKGSNYKKTLLDQASLSFSIVSEVRNLRNTKGLSPKDPLELHIKNSPSILDKPFVAVIQKLSNLRQISFTTSTIDQAAGFLVGTTEFFVPMAGKADVEKERESILKELDYLRGFEASIEKKLSNEKFVGSAPPVVVEMERKKKADAVVKIKSLEENLKKLG